MARMERRFDSLVGVPPDAITGQGGTGLVRAVLEMRGNFDALGERVDALTRAIEADAAARKAEAEAKAAEAAKRREPFSRAAWIAIGSAIGAITSAGALGLLHWATTLHH